MKKHWVLSYPLSAQRRLWSDWADAQADLSLCWMHRSFCWFCHEVAHLIWVVSVNESVRIRKHVSKRSNHLCLVLKWDLSTAVIRSLWHISQFLTVHYHRHTFWLQFHSNFKSMSWIGSHLNFIVSQSSWSVGSQSLLHGACLGFLRLLSTTRGLCFNRPTWWLFSGQESFKILYLMIEYKTENSIKKVNVPHQFNTY